MQKRWILLSFLLACSSNPKIEPVINKTSSDAAPLVPLKNVRLAQYSPSGTQLLLSYHPEHLNAPQVFEYDLLSQKLRQITHQAGKILSLAYLPTQDGIIYASTTDEDKETPFFLRDPNKENLNSEIYTSQRNGSNIFRATKNSGFDGDMDISPTQNFMIYSSERRGRFQLRRVDGKGTETAIEAGLWNDRYFKISPNENHWAWIREKENQFKIVIKTGNQYKDFQNEKFQQIVDLSWHPNSEYVLFSAKIEDRFQIHALRIQDQCLIRLIESNSQDREPSFHPTQSHFIFQREGQIFASYYWPKNTCPALGEVRP